MAEPCHNARYLVLHFLNGRLTATKVTRSWRGALMSKRNHERDYNALPQPLRECWDRATRILPIEAILALQGLEKPDNNLSEADIELLKRMGIGEWPR
jgi:hypothetical protein